MHNNPELVGVESSVDLEPDVVYHHHPPPSDEGRRRMTRSRAVEKEYPPPIPWLVRTENLPSSHMPWVMKRYHTSDGRLVIKEEKVERHEYFKAHRSDGRLVLKLVPLGDAIEETWKELHAEEDDDDEINGGDDEETTHDPLAEDAFGEKRCIKYNNNNNNNINGSAAAVGPNPCGGFGMPVQPFPPPLHT